MLRNLGKHYWSQFFFVVVSETILGPTLAP